MGINIGEVFFQIFEEQRQHFGVDLTWAILFSIIKVLLIILCNK